MKSNLLIPNNQWNQIRMPNDWWNQIHDYQINR